MPHPKAYKAPTTFREVTGCFSELEWMLLHEWQKELYKNLMKEIHQALISLGSAIAASVFTLQAEERGGSDVAQVLISASYKEEEKVDPMGHQDPKEMQNRCSTVNCMEHIDGEHSEGSMSLEKDITEVILSAIKEEVEADSLGYPDSSALQSITFPTGNNATMAGVGRSIIKEDNITYSTVHEDQIERESVPDFPVYLSDTENENKVYRCLTCKKYVTYDSNPIQGVNRKAAHHCCAACEPGFTNKAPLMVHQAPHSGLKLFTCTECEKTFRHKKNLSRHRIIHSGVKPFSCNECEKKFTQKVHLLIHQRIHSGVKPFSCTECGRSFTQKTNLLYHQRTHSGVRQFSCTECSKTFNRKISLLNHQSMHLGVKPSSCNQRKKSFTQMSHLLQY